LQPIIDIFAHHVFCQAIAPLNFVFELLVLSLDLGQIIVASTKQRFASGTVPRRDVVRRRSRKFEQNCEQRRNTIAAVELEPRPESKTEPAAISRGLVLARQQREEQEIEMRKTTLLTSVAAAAVIGFATMAAAQSPEGAKSEGAKPQAQQSAQPEKKAPAGAMMQKQGAEQKPAQSAQTGEKTGAEKSMKPEQRMGQSEKNEATPQKGAQQEQKGVQQKGAQEERPTTQKGAQEEQKGVQQKGAQEERSPTERNAQEQNGKSNTNASVKGNTSVSANKTKAESVKLSQTQRTKIDAVIGHNSSARITTNVNFSISVGTAVPRSVHVEVIPEDVVAVVPEYEGFDYVIVGDQILIIDPNDMTIVAVISA
jgi:Protein of unknown function (DUF1236)